MDDGIYGKNTINRDDKCLALNHLRNPFLFNFYNFP